MMAMYEFDDVAQALAQHAVLVQWQGRGVRTSFALRIVKGEEDDENAALHGQLEALRAAHSLALPAQRAASSGTTHDEQPRNVSGVSFSRSGGGGGGGSVSSAPRRLVVARSIVKHGSAAALRRESARRGSLGPGLGSANRSTLSQVGLTTDAQHFSHHSSVPATGTGGGGAGGTGNSSRVAALSTPTNRLAKLTEHAIV